MIQPNELRKGLLVWWKVDQDHRGTWDCPCIVTEIKRTAFRVKSFDDLEETEPLRLRDDRGGDPTSLREMRVCTIEEVERYVTEQKSSADERVHDARNELEQLTREVENYKRGIDDLLKEIKKPKRRGKVTAKA